MVSTGIGTIRGLNHGSMLTAIIDDSIAISTTLGILEGYHSGNNKDLEQSLEEILDMYINILLVDVKDEKYDKAPFVVKIYSKIILPEF